MALSAGQAAAALLREQSERWGGPASDSEPGWAGFSGLRIPAATVSSLHRATPHPATPPQPLALLAGGGEREHRPRFEREDVVHALARTRGRQEGRPALSDAALDSRYSRERTRKQGRSAHRRRRWASLSSSPPQHAAGALADLGDDLGRRAPRSPRRSWSCRAAASVTAMAIDFLPGSMPLPS